MFITLALTIAALASLAILGWALKASVYAHLSHRWPEVPGTVTASRVELTRGADDEELHRHAITYRYSVGGAVLVGTRVRFGDEVAVGWSGGVLRSKEKYPVGAIVQVRYSPRDPRLCVLEPGVSGIVIAAAVFGATFTLWIALALFDR